MTATKTSTATANGTAVVFPVDSFREAAPHLRRPFTPEAVKFKVQATWPKDNPTGGLVVAYIDARLAVERLNLIVPHLWHDFYEPTPKGLMWCHLTIDGLTRRDVGDGQGKGLVSDALKRAAVKFGVGVSLYAIPKMTIDVNQGHAKQKRSRDGLTLEMTPAGENRMRGIYRMWLDAHGIQGFGDPLDHGDVEGAQGDFEDPPAAESPPAQAPAELVTAADIKALQSAASGLQASQIKGAMVSCGLTPSDPFVPQTAFVRVPKEKAMVLAQALTETYREVLAPDPT